MELFLLNTSHGLMPMYDSDYEAKKKLKIGTTYKAKITVPRNLDFHRKYFALINCAWEYQNEGVQAHFKNSVDLFRKSVEVSAGWCEQEYSITRNEWYERSKSIAFDKMDGAEFSTLYDAVKNVLFTVFLKNIDEQTFVNELINF